MLNKKLTDIGSRMTYEQRPNRPLGTSYCPSLPTSVEPTTLGVETVGEVLARYSKNRRDWEGRYLPGGRQWQASLAVSAPGAGRGDLYQPPAVSLPLSCLNTVLTVL